MKVHRADDRFLSTYDGVVSRHSFSFGSHYDPGNVGFASLVCHNDDEVSPRRGYDEHPHRDLEIVTWVVLGELHHADSSGVSGVVSAGQVQRMSAGSGVVHSEHAGPDRTRFVQMWVRPDEVGTTPSYQQAVVPLTSGWTPIAGGPDALLSMGSSTSVLSSCRVDPAQSVAMQATQVRYVHLFVVTGEVTLSGSSVVALGEGDAVRLEDEGGVDLAGDGLVLAWAMQPVRRPGRSPRRS